LRLYLPSHKNINLQNVISKIELIIEDLNEIFSNQDLVAFWNRILIIEPFVKLLINKEANYGNNDNR
jgi:hypothetical protein